MPDSTACVRCGTPVGADAPQGICPACLHQVAPSGGKVPQLPDIPMGNDPAASTQSNNATRSFHQAGVPQFSQELTADYQPSSPDASQQIRANRIGSYEIISKLGQGGMGEVYLARQKGLNRLVALKLIRSGSAIDPELLGRFSGEAQALARLKHPNIVQVYEIGEEGGVPFISLEYVDGGSLAAKLKSSTQFDPRAAAEIIRVLAEAIATAHTAGILHRDIKPANILLNSCTFLLNRFIPLVCP